MTDNVAWREDREENLLDIRRGSLRHDRVRSMTQGAGELPVATQRRQEREGSLSPEGRFGDEAFAFGASAMVRVMLVFAQVSSMNSKPPDRSFA